MKPCLPDVTIVVPDMGPVGGQEKQMAVLIDALLRGGFRVRLVTRRSTLPPHPRLRLVRLPLPTRPFPLAFPAFFIVGSIVLWAQRTGLVHATGAIVANRVDVITVNHCHRALAARGPFVAIGRDTVAHRTSAIVSGALARLAERWCYRAGRVRIAVAGSSGVVAEIHKYFPALRASTRLIRIGVDKPRATGPASIANTRDRLGVARDSLLAIFVGGDWERKGLRFIMEAVSLLDHVDLLVVGAGDVKAFRKLAMREGLFGRVHFLGRVSDTTPYYAAADVFVLASKYETFSLPAHEAAAYGLPIVAPRLHGVEDILIDGESGWFTDGTPADIARRLRLLQDGPDRRRAMGERSRAAVASLSWARMAAGYRHLYMELRN